MSPTRDDRRARALVIRHGWNATAYQILNPGIEHWFAPRGDAVVGFVRRHGVRVVAGAPVCAKARLAEVVAAWEGDAASTGDRVCYFGAAGRIKDLMEGAPGYATVLLGAQPVWRPAQWSGIIARHASLRAQLHRARNKGVTVAEWSAARATEHPELRRCLKEWLETRGLPPLHFLVEPETLSALEDRRIFVAERAGGVVGFVVTSPVPARKGWLTEQFVRGHQAPNGTVELLLFVGLEAFKSKFHPREWEPIFAVSNEAHFSPGTLYAIAAAFTGGSPITAVARGLGKALRQEARWLLRA